MVPLHSQAEFTDGPWGPFLLNVEIACNPSEEGCKTLAEPDFPHEFTYCNSTYVPELDFKIVIHYFGHSYPPATGKVICIYKNDTGTNEAGLLRVTLTGDWELYNESTDSWESYTDVVDGIYT